MGISRVVESVISSSYCCRLHRARQTYLVEFHLASLMSDMLSNVSAHHPPAGSMRRD